MKWLRVALFLSLTSCTKPNPHSCADGICNDPSLPFCDVAGTLGGEPKECIAVTCTAGEFEACRDDQELRCNATGNNFDLVKCQLGCSNATSGCRLCEPDTTQCTNGTVATCDAGGDVTSTQSCALGCFESEPRCRQIAPSNNLATYLDMVPVGPVVDVANAVFESDTGNVRVGTQSITIPNFLALATGNGVPIRVFVAKSFKLNSATFVATGDPRETPRAGVALLAHEDIVLNGEFLIQSRVGGAVSGCRPAGTGSGTDNGGGNASSSGGGGGANATDGNDGGAVTGRNAGGVKDTASGTAGLVPLRGGCAGGFGGNAGPGTHHNGGGALQLSSGTKIEIDATIDLRGKAGDQEPFDQTLAFINGGGGAGGSLLIEAPVVTLGPSAKLRATGGDGAQGCAIPTATCGAAGLGATPTTAATGGASVSYVSTANTAVMGGGGGGGLGRVRINTATMTYSKSSSAVEDAVVTVGTVGTR